MALADLMVVMEAGRIMQADTPRAVFERPADAFVARFIGGHNVLQDGGRLVAVRADQCRLQPGSGGPAEGGAQIKGRVAAVEYQGSVVRVAIDHGAADEAVILVPDAAFHAAPVAVGEPAGFGWSADHAHAFT